MKLLLIWSAFYSAKKCWPGTPLGYTGVHGINLTATESCWSWWPHNLGSGLCYYWLLPNTIRGDGLNCDQRWQSQSASGWSPEQLRIGWLLALIRDRLFFFFILYRGVCQVGYILLPQSADFPRCQSCPSFHRLDCLVVMILPRGCLRKTAAIYCSRLSF